MMNQPLKGVKVIAFTAYGAGPGAGKILADWGADVVRIDPPKGEPGRTTGLILGMRADEEVNPHFEMINGNTRSVSVNLKTPEGIEILERLLKDANIFISNYRLKALVKLGLDYESMSARHPHIIWGHLDGFGHLGPAADNPGFDTVAFWARTGAMIDFSENGEYPLTPPFGLGDLGTACSLAGGVCAALYNQMKTGKGEKVMTSLFAQNIWNEGSLIQSTMYGDEFPKSRKKANSPLINSFKCKDGEWIFVSVLVYERYFGTMCKLIGREDLIDDVRFNTLDAAKQHREELIAIFDEAFLNHTQDEWDDILTEADIAHDRIKHIKDVASDPQAIANSYVYEYENRNGEKSILPSTPVKFGKIEAPVHRNAPLLGEHSKEVLKECGYADEEIQELIEKGILISK
jgi:crotonobetainyl-CoA:carnitine CoA-transferase CaiB-like acyl-CoA transferase